LKIRHIFLKLFFPNITYWCFYWKYKIIHPYKYSGTPIGFPVASFQQSWNLERSLPATPLAEPKYLFVFFYLFRARDKKR